MFLKKKTLVQNRHGKSYACEIHYKLRNMIKFAKKGDTAFIRFKMGKPYIIGFRKN